MQPIATKPDSRRVSVVNNPEGDPPLPSIDLPWDVAIACVIDGVSVPTIVHQPIIDLHQGTVAGYEALARFPGRPGVGPDRWFKEAAAIGRGVELEFVTLNHTLNALADLPVDTFMSINVSPEMLASPLWAQLLRPFERLDRLVVEVTEHAAIQDYAQARDALARLRERGALFAVDDAGSGYASMQHVLLLRPDFVKLDRAFVMDCDRDPARLALIDAIGSLAARLDAWIVAEGVERSEELDSLLRLGTPLAQGWLLGKPAEGWLKPTESVRQTLASHRRRASDVESLGGLLEVEAVIAGESGPRTGELDRPILLLDQHGRPARWMNVSDNASRPLIAKVTTSYKAIALRAMGRPGESRFLPIVCTDEQGGYIGVVRMERLVEQLARS
jgi:EAL domain-containing protein (putative c-di-GMP-specific phosphodiesterase class I)